MNSSMMPEPDLAYYPARISRDKFVELVRQAHEMGLLESYIGYEATCKHIEDISQIKVALNREPVSLKHGDMILVCKLKYRLANADMKNDKSFQDTINADDFEYWQIDVRDYDYSNYSSSSAIP
ncbi:MAG: DUF1874 domain-containing protein [Methylacidiphilales bacterium]|nr:DUF1874 domain-containing protein [Candidatus Methylacidiphilales bacterium]